MKADALSEMIADRYRSPSEQERYVARAEDGLLAWERTVATRHMNRPGRLLDVGCGAGREMFALHEMGHAVVAVDTDENLLRAARERAAHKGMAIECEPCDGRRLRFDDDSFDYVNLWSQVLGNVPVAAARAALLGECGRVLRPGGVLSFSVHNRAVTERAAREQGLVVEENGMLLEDGDFILQGDGGDTPCYWHYFTQEEALGLCKAADCDVLECALALEFGQAEWDSVWVCVGQRPA